MLDLRLCCFLLVGDRGKEIMNTLVVGRWPSSLFAVGFCRIGSGIVVLGRKDIVASRRSTARAVLGFSRSRNFEVVTSSSAVAESAWHSRTACASQKFQYSSCSFSCIHS